MGAYWNAFAHYFDFSGRATRGDYWAFQIVLAIVLVAGILLDLRFFPRAELADGPVFLCLSVAHLIPQLSINVRRLHDSGRSGWKVLLLLIPLVNLIYWLIYALAPSDEGDNHYGPHPDALDSAAPLRPTAQAPRQEPGLAVRETSALLPIEQLEKLAALKASGAIDDQEFAEMKARLLGSGGVRQ